MSATTNLGKVSVTPKGAWAITNAYEILDIVTSGGSSYLAKQDVPTGVPLNNTSYWIMIAEKGDGGEVTSASASISGGYGTPGVSVTAGGTPHERTLAFAFTNLRGEKGETGNGIDSVYKTGTSGLVDTYTILFTDGSTYEFEVNNGTASIDDTLTKSGWAADAKVVGDTKASIDGFYETMGVGVADNLTPYSEDSGATQDIPFIAQGTGCGNGESVVDTGSYLQFKKKLGNTVAVNQLIRNYDFSDGTNNWSVYDSSKASLSVSGGIATLTFLSDTGTYSRGLRQTLSVAPVIGRKYLISIRAKASAAGSYAYDFSGSASSSTGFVLPANTWTTAYLITTATGTSTTFIIEPAIGTGNANDTLEISYVTISDLSIWHGSTDRIPSDLLSHPENWGRYYSGSLAHNAGTFESADGTVLKSIGRNLWDEETESGSLNLTTGQPQADSSKIRAKNYIRVSPNTAYYKFTPSSFWNAYYDAEYNYIGYGNASAGTFTTPANCHYLRFNLESAYGTTYKHDITISLYYPGESGYDQYYPYSVLAEVDTGSEVLRSAGAVADEKTPDGTITRRVGYVDMGTLNWTAISRTRFETSTPLSGAKYYTSSTAMPNVHCSRYETVNFNTMYQTDTDKCISVYYDGAYIQVRDTSYATAADFKTAMSGVYLYYELATPTTEQGTAFAENIPCDDFGSMYWTQTKGIPQGNEIFYPVDYKASIDTLYNRVEGDMSRIVIDDDLNSYNTKTEDDAKYGTKDALGGTLRQLLAVSKSIDFENTDYVDFGTLTWTRDTSGTYPTFWANVTGMLGTDAVAMCSKYTYGGSEGWATVTNGNYEKEIVTSQTNSTPYVMIQDSTYSTADAFAAAMKGQLLAYEKASS